MNKHIAGGQRNNKIAKLVINPWVGIGKGRAGEDRIRQDQAGFIPRLQEALGDGPNRPGCVGKRQITSLGGRTGEGCAGGHLGSRELRDQVNKAPPLWRCCHTAAVKQDLCPRSQVLPPAGHGCGLQPQRFAAQPLPRQDQRARFAVADHADHGGARMGLEGSPDLAHHLLGRIENNHPRAGELLWRHRAQKLGADQHQVGRVAGWRRRSGRPWLRRQGGEGLGYASASWDASLSTSWDARPAAVRARPLGARGRSGAGRRQAMCTKAQAGGERANSHRNPNVIYKSTLPLNAAKMLPTGGKVSPPLLRGSPGNRCRLGSN